jgi:hypothetical protein
MALTQMESCPVGAVAGDIDRVIAKSIAIR